MAKRPPTRKRLPVHYPSIPDREAKAGVHNEPEQRPPADVIPASTFKLAATDSKADLRLRIEQLLMRR